MGLFTFLFLGAEYLFVDVLSHIVSEDRTVLAQNYALGISAAGFALYPLFNRFCKDRLKAVCSVIIGFLSVLCLVFICSGTAYTAIFATGLVLFLLLGLVGSGVFYVSMRMMKTDKYLAFSDYFNTASRPAAYAAPRPFSSASAAVGHRNMHFARIVQKFVFFAKKCLTAARWL